jgi:shikimate kinase
VTPVRGNVVLTGFMGTGKTTTGLLLAERLGYEFVDTDAMIEARHGPIPDIFRDQGEAAFRRIEGEVAAELAEREGLVISTGGRMMVDTDNAAALAANGAVFCLTASVDTILARVTADDAMSGRPLLDTDDARGRIEQLLVERAAAYARFRQVDTNTRAPDAVADEIIEALTDSDPHPPH